MDKHSTYKLTHHLTIMYNDNDGTKTPSPDDWKTLCTPWAEKSGLTGRMFIQAAAAQAESDVTFTIRYRTDIKPTMRIIDGTDTEHPYEVTVEPVDYADAHQWLEIHVRRIGTNGR